MNNRLYLSKRLLLLRWVWCVAMLLGPCTLARAVPFPPDALPGLDIGGSLPGGYEPSGVVWHHRLDRLFVVSDNGTVSYMKADGTNVVNWSVEGDLEGIAVADYSSNVIYLGVENPDGIREFDIGSGSVTRTFDLTPWMTGPSNSGLEALTFVPDASNPEGGLFYAGLQADGSIYKFELPIQSSVISTTVMHKGTITPVAGRTDISGLHYDVDSRVLYAIFDSSNTLRAMDAAGSLIKEWSLAGSNQEGIVLDVDTNNLFIAEDSGRVMVYSPFPIIPEGDINGDGFVGADDLVTVLTYWGQSGITRNEGDLTGDQFVGADDYVEVLTCWGSGTPPEPIPESTTLIILLSLSSLALLRWRKQLPTRLLTKEPA